MTTLKYLIVLYCTALMICAAEVGSGSAHAVSKPIGPKSRVFLDLPYISTERVPGPESIRSTPQIVLEFGEGVWQSAAELKLILSGLVGQETSDERLKINAAVDIIGRDQVIDSVYFDTLNKVVIYRERKYIAGAKLSIWIDHCLTPLIERLAHYAIEMSERPESKAERVKP